MSIDKNYYVIAGYDLTGYKTDKYDDLKWTDEGEKYLCYQSINHIQLFDDPMSDKHFYLGYIFAKGDEYDFETTKVNILDLKDKEQDVVYELKQLRDIGIVDENIFESENLKYEMIVFEECC